MSMPKCPACRSDRVVVVVSPVRRAFCVTCGTRWTREDGQIRIERGAVNPAHPSIRGRATGTPATGESG